MSTMTGLMMVCVMAGVILVGCAQKTVADNATQVIEQSKAQGPVEAQANFLMEQANALVSSKNYQEAMNVAHYVIANFKDKAPEAQKLLQDIQVNVQQMFQEKMGTVKKDVGAAAKDLNKTLGSFGK